MLWLEDFRRQYATLLDCKVSAKKRGLVEGLYCRYKGFELIFTHLVDQKLPEYHIVETGTLRNFNNWKDGQSARLFVEFVKSHGGSVSSVDIDPTAVTVARSALPKEYFSVHCSDSVTWLAQQKNLHVVDLFYLDSWDVKWHNDSDSAEHHLKEFQIIEPYLKSNAVVAIDDNSKFLSTHKRTGKGRRIVEYLADTRNLQPWYDAYQILYRF